MSRQDLSNISKLICLTFCFQFLFIGCSQNNLADVIDCESHKDLNTVKKQLARQLNDDSSFIEIYNIDSKYVIKPFEEGNSYKDKGNIVLELFMPKGQFLLNDELFDFDKFDLIIREKVLKYLSNKDIVDKDNNFNKSSNISSGLVFEIKSTTIANKKEISSEQALAMLTLLNRLDCIINTLRDEITKVNYNQQYLSLKENAKQGIENILPKYFYIYKQDFQKTPFLEPIESN